MDYLCSECYAELEVEEDYRNNSQYTTTKKSFVVPCMCHTRQISRAEERVSDFKDELMDAQDKIGAMTKTLNKLNKLLSGSKNKNNIEAIELIIKTLGD